MRDVIASYEALVNLFERTQFFLQRLNCYIAIQLTPEMILLFGKIMAQVLSILALSTKEMKERRISMSFYSVYSFMTNDRIEKFIKRLAGKTPVEDAFQRLDLLTKEENLMAVARNLEITHGVDDKVTTINEVVRDVDGNVKATKELTYDVRDNMIAIKEDTKYGG
jgi:hypothetical protein